MSASNRLIEPAQRSSGQLAEVPPSAVTTPIVDAAGSAAIIRPRQGIHHGRSPLRYGADRAPGSPSRTLLGHLVARPSIVRHHPSSGCLAPCDINHISTLPKDRRNITLPTRTWQHSRRRLWSTKPAVIGFSLVVFGVVRAFDVRHHRRPAGRAPRASPDRDRGPGTGGLSRHLADFANGRRGTTVLRPKGGYSRTIEAKRRPVGDEAQRSGDRGPRPCQNAQGLYPSLVSRTRINHRADHVLPRSP